VRSPTELWNLLAEKRTGYKDYDASRINLKGYYHPNQQRPGSIHMHGACLIDEDPRLFDHVLFGIKPAEVLTLDVMQRKIIEVAYEAFESAGDSLDKIWGSRTGVFIGNFGFDHMLRQMYDVDFSLPHSATGGSTTILSNRIHHVFNLKGPSMTIDTACASSMYALHVAVNAIKAGDCDAALVGGTNIILSPEMQQMVTNLGILSSTSRCRTFDATADGYCRAEGFCAIYLRKHNDAISGNYPIRAVIRSTAVNSNGTTAGISHPSAESQEALIRHAYAKACLPTHLTGYFECHGTGTPVGDSVEVAAVSNVFKNGRTAAPLLIGSIKTNLGHAEGASGLIGVMKAVLALEKGIIPPTVGVTKLNPNSKSISPL
jgi:acyl transferase domain-containing protein